MKSANTYREIAKAMESLIYLSMKVEVDRRAEKDKEKEEMLKGIVESLDRAYYSLCEYKDL